MVFVFNGARGAGGRRVFVKVSASEEKTAGGILLPDTAKEKPVQGEIVAVGKGKLTTAGPRRLAGQARTRPSNATSPRSDANCRHALTKSLDTPPRRLVTAHRMVKMPPAPDGKIYSATYSNVRSNHRLRLKSQPPLCDNALTNCRFPSTSAMSTATM